MQFDLTAEKSKAVAWQNLQQVRTHVPERPSMCDTRVPGTSTSTSTPKFVKYCGVCIGEEKKELYS